MTVAMKQKEKKQIKNEQLKFQNQDKLPVIYYLFLIPLTWKL